MIGIGIWLWGNSVPAALLAAPATPTLTLTSATTDNTPDFTCDANGDLVEGDTVRFQYSTDSGFAGASEITNTIDAAEDAANSFNFSTGVLANNTWYFRARTERPGHTSSAWSNTVSETIAAAVGISSVALTSNAGADNTYKAGDVVSATVTFTDVVNVTGTPQLTLNVGGSNKVANYASGTGTAALVFSYTIQAGDTDTNGISIGANALALNSGTIKDVTTADATITHSSVADNASHKVDTTAPTISTVALSSSAGADNTYKAGDVVSATVTFSEAVTVTGTPQLTLNVGGSNKTANYASGSGTTALVFSYAVQAGDTDTNGISIGANAVALNSGTIVDAAGNNATITHSSVADNASHKVDTTAPTISTASTANNAENSALAITLAADETATWSIVGGADQARFEISGTTLRWASNGTKDFESPNDADANNTYIVTVRATDVAGNTTDKTITVTVTDVDEIAPALSSLTDVKTGSSTADIGATTNEGNGTLFVVASTSSTAPSGAQIIAGQMHTGAAAAAAGSVAVSSTGAKTVGVTGLSGSTSYFGHSVHRDAAGNVSNVVSGDGFTTDAGGYSYTNTEAAAVAAAFTTPPDNTRAAIIDTLVGALKTAGTWSKMDVLYVIAAADSQAALINWKNPGTNTLSVQGTCTFTADSGYKSDGSTGYLDLGSAYGAFTKLVQDSVHLGGWLAGTTSANWFVWGRFDTNGRYSLGSNTSGSFNGRVSESASNSWGTISGGVGGEQCFFITRRTSNTTQAYINATSNGTSSTTSEGVGSGNANILRSTTFFAPSTQTCRCAHFGEQLSGTEVTNTYNAIHAYLQSVAGIA
jgi:hypothetical protein